jgi:hypothetical protein
MKNPFIILFLFSAWLSFANSWNGTYLGRISEFDAENAIGLVDTGNFIITFEHISYSLDEAGGIDVSYHYKLKRTSRNINTIFGLSLRNRGIEMRGDVEVDTLNVLVNYRKTDVFFVRYSYDAIGSVIFNDNGIPIDVDWNNDEDFNKYFEKTIFEGYRGWYYFKVDFFDADEVDIRINYQTILDDTSIRYNSHPFWIPIANNTNLEVTIENSYNESFLSYITDCNPTDTLVTKNWILNKPGQNKINIIFTSSWFSERKEVNIGFSSIYTPRGSPSFHFFHVIWWDDIYTGSYHEYGVFLCSRKQTGGYRCLSDNISRRELAPYELIFLNRWQLRIMRNAFYARHRYRFSDNTLNYFLYELYYDNYIEDRYNSNFSEEVFSPIERRNIEIIQRLENLVN